MKKVLAVIFLGFFCIGSSYAQIIELDKCISRALLGDNNSWSEKLYKEANTQYYKFHKEPKDVGPKFVSVVDSFAEIYLDKQTRKEYIKEGFKKIKFADKNALSIDTVSGTITTIFSYTDEYWKYSRESDYRWTSAMKKLKPNTDIQVNIDYQRDRQKTDIQKFKITDYVSGIIMGYRIDQERIYPNERYSIKIDLDKLEVSEGYLNNIHNNPLVKRICSNPKKRIKSIKSNKTQTNKKTGTFKSILGNILGK